MTSTHTNPIAAFRGAQPLAVNPPQLDDSLSFTGRAVLSILESPHLNPSVYRPRMLARDLTLSDLRLALPAMSSKEKIAWAIPREIFLGGVRAALTFLSGLSLAPLGVLYASGGIVVYSVQWLCHGASRSASAEKIHTFWLQWKEDGAVALRTIFGTAVIAWGCVNPLSWSELAFNCSLFGLGGPFYLLLNMMAGHFHNLQDSDKLIPLLSRLPDGYLRGRQLYHTEGFVAQDGGVLTPEESRNVLLLRTALLYTSAMQLAHLRGWLEREYVAVIRHKAQVEDAGGELSASETRAHEAIKALSKQSRSWASVNLPVDDIHSLQDRFNCRGQSEAFDRWLASYNRVQRDLIAAQQKDLPIHPGLRDPALEAGVIRDVYNAARPWQRKSREILKMQEEAALPAQTHGPRSHQLIHDALIGAPPHILLGFSGEECPPWLSAAEVKEKAESLRATLREEGAPQEHLDLVEAAVVSLRGTPVNASPADVYQPFYNMVVLLEENYDTHSF